jgi:hypothetical protein
MEKRAVVAEERAAEAIVMERKACHAQEAREKQVASMRLRVRVCLVSAHLRKEQRHDDVYGDSDTHSLLSSRSPTPQLNKMSLDLQKSENQRKELREYVGKLERKIQSKIPGAERRSPAFNSSKVKSKFSEESLLEALSSLEGKNLKLHSALQVGNQLYFFFPAKS